MGTLGRSVGPTVEGEDFGVVEVSVQAPKKLDRSDHFGERDRQVFVVMIEGQAWTLSTA